MAKTEIRVVARRSVRSAATAGLAYVAIVFAAGFVLGTVREIHLTARLGRTFAILFELPVIVTFSWFACRWIVERLNVPTAVADRSIMGGVALAVLLLADFSLTTLAFGRTLHEHLDGYRNLDELLGLAGQLLFAAFPCMQATSMRPRQR